jgi:sugar phosphate permease
MLAVMVSLFFFSFFYRTSPAVISPYLLRDFSLGAEKLGLLSSIFFIVFAVAQVPLGPALDFIGPRKVVSVLGTLGALGSLTFALAPSYGVCLLGRGLTGLGMSCMYMGSLTIVANWYSPRQFATLTGIVSSLGNTGALTATIPLALLAGSLGWRGSFHLFAAVNLLLAVLAWVVIRDRPARAANQPVLPPEDFSLGKAFRAVLGTSTFWFIATLNFFTAGSFLAFQGLWGGPFLMDGFGLSPVEAGSILSMIAFGYIIGCPLTGAISDRLVPSRKKLTLILLSLYLVPLLSLSFFLGPGRDYLLFPVFFSIGLFASGVVLSIAHLKELFPSRIVGTALSLNNLFAIGGAGVLQYLMGWVIERHPAAGRVYPIEAYREAFLLLLGGMGGALLLYLRAKNSPPSFPSPPKK